MPNILTCQRIPYLAWVMGVQRVFVLSTRGHVARELLERAKFIDVRKLKRKISPVDKKIWSYLAALQSVITTLLYQISHL